MLRGFDKIPPQVGGLRLHRELCFCLAAWTTEVAAWRGGCRDVLGHAVLVVHMQQDGQNRTSVASEVPRLSAVRRCPSLPVAAACHAPTMPLRLCGLVVSHQITGLPMDGLRNKVYDK